MRRALVALASLLGSHFLAVPIGLSGPHAARAQAASPATRQATGLTSVERARQRRQRAVERVLTEVERDLQRARPADALRRLRAALQGDPRELRWLARYAELAVPFDDAAHLDRRGSPAGAADLLARVARRDALPWDPEVATDVERERALALHAALAEALLERYSESFARVVDAARLQDPQTVLCLRQIAALLVTREQLELAQHALELARQYLPQDQVLLAELAHVLLARGAGEQAITLFAERYAIAPDQLEARRDLAYALTTRGRAGEALALLSAVRATCEANLGCSLEAARIALEAGRPPDALAYAQKRLLAQPNDLDALFVSADAHTRTGNVAAARAAYEQVLRVRPESVRAKQALEQLQL